jgi:tetraacyldisaccharide 4'-kinase
MPPLQHRLRSAWQQRGPLACALWPVSLAYGAAAALHRAAARREGAAQKLPAPVIVIGNVVAGGAGKTPVALAVAEHLKTRGWRPGIVSRGYGRAGGDCREVAPGDDPRLAGDEPLLLRRRAAAPVFVARRRLDAARALLAAHPDCDILICDDGLQHLALARDVEVVVFDARGAGNGWLLPAGPLREPWPRGAGSAAQLLVRTEPGDALPLPEGATLHEARRSLAPDAVRSNGERVPLASLQGQRLVAVAGIARPEAFFAMLRAAGLTLAAAEALPDHHDFEGWQRPPGQRETLLCTEKDAPKLWRSRPDALALPLDLQAPPAFFAALDAALAARGYDPGNGS